MSKDSRKDSDRDRHTPILKDFSDTLQRVEIITGTGRRRRWSADAKAAIIAESFALGASVSAVARRHDISPSLLFLWRRQTTRAKVAARRAGDVPPGFVPVAITGGGGELPSREEQAAIEIQVGAVRIRVRGRSTAGAVRGAGGSRDGWPMIGLRPGLSIWIATQPVDFRRGMDSLAMLVSEAFGADPFDGGLYIFRSKRRDRVKILTWDGSGLVLYYKASVTIPPSIAWAGAGACSTPWRHPRQPYRTHYALDPVLHRNDVEGFLDGLPNFVQPLAAARADVALDIDHDVDARQMLRKLPPVASRRSLSTALRSVRQPASGTDVLERIVSGRTKINQLHMLLPWNWKAERDSSPAKLAA